MSPMCLFKYFPHKKNKRIARWRNIVLSSKRPSILMALNECAVHVYVIIIEKKKVVIHLNHFHYCLMSFGALTGINYVFFKVCTFMIATHA